MWSTIVNIFSPKKRKQREDEDENDEKAKQAKMSTSSAEPSTALPYEMWILTQALLATPASARKQFFHNFVGDTKSLQVASWKKHSQDLFIHVQGEPFQVQNYLNSAALGWILAPFLLDKLKLREGFESVKKALVKRNSTMFGLPTTSTRHWASAMKDKELLVGLFHIVHHSKHCHLMSFVAAQKLPIPFLFPTSNENEWQSSLTLFAEVFLQAKSNPLMVNIGTMSSAGKGKSTLLNDVMMSQDVKFETNGGILHDLSIDFLPAYASSDAMYHVVDVHGFSNDTSTAFRKCAKYLQSKANVVLLHCTMSDFTRYNVPNEEFASLIADVKCCTAYIIVLLRDYNENDAIRAEKALANLQTLLSAKTCIAIPNLASISSPLEYVQNVQDEIKNCEPSSMTSLPNYYSMLKELHFEQNVSVLEPAESLTDQPKLDILAKEVISLLQEVVQGGFQLREVLFPNYSLQIKYNNLANAKVEKEKDLAKALDEESKAIVSQNIELLKVQMHEISSRTAELSPFVTYFAKSMQRQDIHFMKVCKVFAASINAVKTPFTSRLRDKLVQIANCIQKEQNEAMKNKHIKDHKALMLELDEVDVSLDTIWRELAIASRKSSSTFNMTFLEQQTCMNPDFFFSCFAECVMDGNPMQLMDGSTLDIDENFVTNVLSRIGKHSLNRKLVVISVLGVQSSAKSTLLNYLYGCGFSMASARCTKGLYISYMRSHDLDIIVLDSEGLASAEARDLCFDRRVAVMLMACSHIVLVNIKGEIDSHTNDMIEVSLFALRLLAVDSICPSLNFVLRDQLDVSDGIRNIQLNSITKRMADSAAVLKEASASIRPIEVDNIFLMHPAFNSVHLNGIQTHVPNLLFSHEVLNLREKLLELATTTNVSSNFNMASWLTHCISSWKIVATNAQWATLKDVKAIVERTEARTSANKVMEHAVQRVGKISDKHYMECFAHCESMMASPSQTQALSISDLKNEATHNINTEVENLQTEVQESFSKDCATAGYAIETAQEFAASIKFAISHAQLLQQRPWNLKFQSLLESASKADLIAIANEEFKSNTFDKDKFKEKALAKMKEIVAKYETTYKQLVNQANESLKLAWKALHFKLQLAINELIFTTNAPSNSEIAIFLVAEKPGTSKDSVLAVKQTVVDEYENTIKAVAATLTTIQNNTIDIEKAKEIMRQVGYCFETMEQLAKNAGCYIHDKIPLFSKMLLNFKSQVLSHVTQQSTDELAKKKDQCNHMIETVISMCDQLMQTKVADVPTAKLIAKEILCKFKSVLEAWLITADERIRSDLRVKFSDPNNYAQHLFDISFKLKDWNKVIKYVENVNGLLAEVFDSEFDQAYNIEISKAMLVFSALHSNTKAKLLTLLSRWKLSPVTFSDQEMQQLLFKYFIASMKKSAAQEMSSIVQECNQKYKATLPAISNFDCDCSDVVPELGSLSIIRIVDSTCFVTTLAAELEQGFAELSQDLALAIKPYRADTRSNLWHDAAGCNARCPLCTAKCCAAVHTGTDAPVHQHACHRHLYPAFGGYRYVKDGTPVLHLCTATENVHGSYERDGAIYTQQAYLSKYYPGWDLQVKENEQETEMYNRFAWQALHAHFCKHYGMTDNYEQDETVKKWNLPKLVTN